MLDQMYAVAVRDEELFLALTVRRDPKSDVYVHIPRQGPDDRRYHASFHASGQSHHKSFGRTTPSKPILVRLRQKPDSHFQGAENITQTNLPADLPRSVGIICRPQGFKGVFEIPVSDLVTDPSSMQVSLSVDLTAPTTLPFCPPMYTGATISQQAVLDEAVPWIVITLIKPPMHGSPRPGNGIAESYQTAVETSGTGDPKSPPLPDE
jgi:hypothetical protein